MKRRLSKLICAALLLGAPLAAAETLPASPPAAYAYQDAFPGQVAGAGFEMPRQTFMDLLAAQGLTYRTNTAADVVAVATNGAPFSEVVYFFNSDACDCLTEIEIRFADEASAIAYFNTKYPLQDIEGEYFAHDGVSLYRVNAWRFKTKVYLVAILPNTRWSNQ